MIPAASAPLFFAAKNERTFTFGSRAALPAPERLAYRVLPGDAALRPLVALHGLGSSHEDLLEVARSVGAPAVLLDLPGFGRSEPVDGDYPVALAARRVLALLDELEMERPVWLGCSYGGHVALRASLDAPQRVGGLVLAASGGLNPDPPAALAAAFDERVLAGRSLAQVAASCDALVGRPNPSTRAFLARRLRAHASGNARYRSIARAAAGALTDDAPRRLEEVACPVTLVHGARDVLVPLPVARSAATRLRAALIVLDGIGHMPWLEAPTRLATCVRAAVSLRH